jgi:glycosyltransferase 2 family protein
MAEGFSPKVRRGLHLGGAILSVVALLFVLFRFLDYRDQINFSQYTSSQWLFFSMASVAYGAVGVLMALAWRLLLKHYQVQVTGLWATWAYGISQLVKYVPGNIFHLVGRQAIGMAAGLPARPLAKSAFWDIFLLAAMGSAFSPLLLPLLGGEWLISGLVFGLAILSMLWFWSRIGASAFVNASMLYLLFLFLSAALFVGLLGVFCATCSLPLTLWMPVMGAYVIAWLIGLVTPGSPAGLGVREVMLYSLLQNWIEQADLLMIIALGRLMTLGGDVLFFVLALLVGRQFSVAMKAPRAAHGPGET